MTDSTARTTRDPLHRAATLAVQNRRWLTIAGAALVLALGGGWFTISAKARRDAFASRALRDAQQALGAGNAPLAASDLARLVQNYGGTASAGEGALLLAQIRLDRSEVEQAIGGLREFLDRRPDNRFAAAAYALLGTALEQAGRPAEAAAAHQEASAQWPYEYLKAQSLLEVGRTFRLAGDTTRAAAAYQMVLDQYRETPSFLEAQLRLGELRPSRVGG
ncbi:MAG TPA: tetratricopeptide repeat protein [Gemmatimonadales bacterium]